MQQPPLYILTGGRSQRFGQEKAWYRLPNGDLWHEHVAKGLGYAPESVVLVDRPRHEKDALLKQVNGSCRLIVDTPSDVGPLGGLSAALQDRLAHAGPGWLLLASCDLVHPAAAWIQDLQASITPSVQAVVFKTDRFHPFPGLFHTDGLPVIQQAITQSQLSLQKLFLMAATAAVPFAKPEGPPQANTPAALSVFFD